ncbi:ribokinase [Agromyces sp. NBRC 114283]|uniref:ribokinase n=1 Tax=Agromyces sp. NBRC 114283 TaxID=2994521 RepID=UPI0024A49B19|nr:ribokinase [Agromyces sp. NBRC 114283]GLU89706.1 ribokinase [Agromyces sp. NBRC 114283]
MTGSPRPVAVVGAANVDLRVRVDRLPLSGETVLASRIERTLGGKAANQAIAARRSGADVRLVSGVAADDGGEWLRRRLDEAGIDGHWVESERTGVAIVAVDRLGEKQIMVAPATPAPPTLGRAVTEVLAEAGFLLVQRELGAAIAELCLAAGRDLGVTTILNAGTADAVTPAELALADALILNELEFELSFGSPFDGDTSWRPGMPETTLVTLGRRGVAMLSPAGRRFTPGHTVHAVDTVGAGDAFCGGFVAELSAGVDTAEALRWGQAAAALACTREGAAESIPTRAEIRAFLHQGDDPNDPRSSAARHSTPTKG